MRVIKLGIISVIILFGVITAISLAIPSRIRISKAINIKAPNESVFHLIKDTAQWPKWNPAYDPTQPAPVGLSRKLIRANDSIVLMQLQQFQRTPVISGWQIHRFASTDSTTLQWYMDFHLGWLPWQKFSSMLYEKTYGVMMEQGLKNIKGIVEE